MFQAEEFENEFFAFYNIASRAAQSNSVYVSVLKIPIVHAYFT